MHASLIALLKKKSVSNATLSDIVIREDISDEELQDFKDTYAWDIRSYGKEDDPLIMQFLKDINRYPKLSPAEEREFIYKYCRWDQLAKEQLIIHMTCYVVALAKRYYGLGLEFMDLVSEWLLWLNKAIEGFDPDKAWRLSTYASSWINTTILSALAKFSGTTSLPLHVINEIKFINGVEQTLFQTLWRNPTMNEIVAAAYKAHHLWRNISVERIGNLLTLRHGWSYISRHMWDSDTMISDLIEDKNTLPPDEVAQRDCMCENVLKLIKDIASQRDADIIMMKFWINCPTFTLSQISKDKGISRERARQIVKRFVIKVRTCPQLKVFLSL